MIGDTEELKALRKELAALRAEIAALRSQLSYMPVIIQPQPIAPYLPWNPWPVYGST